MVKETKRFDIGSKVMGRWPNTNLYFAGEIIDYNDIQYLVRFEDSDSSEFPLKFSEVHLPFETRSRSKSRGRTPTRRSPGRKASKSPARKQSKSPGRKPKSPNQKDLAENTEIKDTKMNLRARPSATRQSARIAANSSEKPLKDDEKSLKVDKEAIIKKVADGQTWKGLILRFLRAIWATIFPLPTLAVAIALPFIIIQMCTKNVCGLNIPAIPKNLKSYYDLNAVMIVAGFFLYQILCMLIPIGKVVKLKNGVNYRCNGYIPLVGTISFFLAAVQLQYDVPSWYLLYRQILTSCVGLCFIMGVVLYIRSFYTNKRMKNPGGNSGYLVPDLIYGRDFTPLFGNIDFKMLMFRFWMMMVILLELTILLRHWKLSKETPYSINLMVLTAMHGCYAIDFIWFEESLLSTYEYSKTGMGLLRMLEYIIIPYSFAFFSRFVLNHGNELPWYCLVGVAALFLVGYVIVRGANSQKHAFRSNPADPALVHLESLPTAAGSRLLVSGWWGFVRHPNYLGDIIVQLAVALLCGFEFALPWIMFGISVISLIVRIFNVEADCKKKFGLGWSSYTSRVKYRLIPKVF